MDTIMSSSEPRGPLAVLNLPKGNLALILYAKNMNAALTGNAQLANPPIPLTTFAADIAAFDAAETLAATKAKGTAKARNARKLKVVQDMGHYCDWVQGVADAQTSPAAAAEVITSAGLSVRATPTHSKAALAAKNGALPGSVALAAKAVGRPATYYWMYSLDQKTWSSVPDTMKASTVISGLTSGQTYYFRFSALTRAGAVGYSQIVSLLVH
jgi:hypothetical protein